MRVFMSGICLVALLQGAGQKVCAQKDGKLLASTPPMGWNDYNHYNMDISDAKIRAAADAMIASGMRDAGYIYVNIDDGWEGKRVSQGYLHPINRFPNMSELADYLNARGLKLGIYSSPGPKTCGGMEGSYGHEEQDAATFAQWGVDYLKYDLCSYIPELKAYAGSDVAKAREREVEIFGKMAQALRRTGRPIILSLCQYGWDRPWEWGPQIGAQLWRTTADIKDNYDRMSLIGFSEAGLSRYVGPGHWLDPDMLEVGNGGMNLDEYRTHMTLWAMLAAPLIAGNDPTNMTAETRATLLNRDVIAIDQDGLGYGGDRAFAEGPVEVWTRHLLNGALAVAVFNRGDNRLPYTLELSRIGVRGSVSCKDVWLGTKVTARSSYGMVIERHGVVLLRLNTGLQQSRLFRTYADSLASKESREQRNPL